MPNWVRNSMDVTGPLQDLRAFKEAARTQPPKHDDRAEELVGQLTREAEQEQELDFNSFVPKPDAFDGISTGATRINGKSVNAWREVNGQSVEVSAAELADLKAKYGAENWRDWACNNWGCKWNCGEVDFEDRGDSLHYGFDTPWSPPTPIFEAMSSQWPSLRFEVYMTEEGNNFPPTTQVWECGNMVSEVEHPEDVTTDEDQ